MDDVEQWFRRDYPVAYRTACLLLRDPDQAQAAVQTAWARIWRFRSSLPSGDERRPFLYRALLAECRLRLKDQKAGCAVDVGAPEVLALPEELYVPLVLRFWTGLSEEHIALATRTRPGTVRSRLDDARQLLAQDPRRSAEAMSPAEVSP